MTIGYPDYGGSRLIKTPTNLDIVGTGTVNAGQTVTLGPFDATGISYGMYFMPYQSAVGTVPFCTVEVAVSNVVTLKVDDAAFDLPMAPARFASQYNLRGPLFGNTLNLTITNHDTVAMDYELQIVSSNNSQLSHTVGTQVFTSMMAGYNLPPNCIPVKGVLGTWYQAAVPSGNVVPFIVPPAPGPVSIGVRADSGLGDVSVTAAPYISNNNFAGLSQGNLLAGRTDANGNFMATINFSRTSMAFSIQNHNAGAQGISTTIVYDVTSG